MGFSYSTFYSMFDHIHSKNCPHCEAKYAWGETIPSTAGRREKVAYTCGQVVEYTPAMQEASISTTETCNTLVTA